MPKQLSTFAIQPGLYTEGTQRDVDKRWFTGMNVRFRKMWPEKLGGWADAEVGEGVTGICRQLHDWVALNDTVWTALGTHSHLFVFSNGAFTDITPLDPAAPGSGSGTLGTDPFTTTISSAAVSVAHTSHGRVAGDYVIFDGAAAVGGITIDGEYAVTSVTDADNYVVTHSASATSSATGGGASVTYEYLIPTGQDVATQVGGYGAGGYGEGGYGEPSDTGITSEPRIWVLDNWGEDLIAGIRGGSVYAWDKSVGTGTRAQLIANAPTEIGWLKVSDNRQLIIFGGNGDPLLIAWSDEEDYTDFTPSATNAAGDLRLEQGGRIITALQGRSEMVVWTDVSVHAFRPQNAPFYWGLAMLAHGVQLAGPNASVEVNGVVYFMGAEDFHVYDGAVRTMPCDIRNTVFGDINRFALPHVYAALNSDFTEIWWCYPTADSNENDRVAIYNYVEHTWSIATMERTAFHDSSSQFRKPYGIGTAGTLYKHESGYNDDTSEMTGYLESYFAEIGEGDEFALIDRAIPDFLEIGGTVNLTLKSRRYAQAATVTEDGPHALADTTEKIDTRLRGRQVAMRLEFEGLNTYFRMGNWKLRGKPAGRR